MHRVFNLLWFSDACCYCSILLKSEIIFISVDCVCLSLSLPFFFWGGALHIFCAFRFHFVFLFIFCLNIWLPCLFFFLFTRMDDLFFFFLVLTDFDVISRLLLKLFISPYCCLVLC